MTVIDTPKAKPAREMWINPLSSFGLRPCESDMPKMIEILRATRTCLSPEALDLLDATSAELGYDIVPDDPSLLGAGNANSAVRHKDTIVLETDRYLAEQHNKHEKFTDKEVAAAIRGNRACRNPEELIADNKWRQILTENMDVSRPWKFHDLHSMRRNLLSIVSSLIWLEKDQWMWELRNSARLEQAAPIPTTPPPVGRPSTPGVRQQNASGKKSSQSAAIRAKKAARSARSREETKKRKGSTTSRPLNPHMGK